MAVPKTIGTTTLFNSLPSPFAEASKTSRNPWVVPGGPPRASVAWKFPSAPISPAMIETCTSSLPFSSRTRPVAAVPPAGPPPAITPQPLDDRRERLDAGQVVRVEAHLEVVDALPGEGAQCLCDLVRRAGDRLLDATARQRLRRRLAPG